MNSIPCPLKTNALKHPEQPAIISNDMTLSYQDFDRAVDRCAARLIQLEIKQGETIAIISVPTNQYLILLPALWRISAIACLLNEHDTPNTINEQLQNVRCKTLLTSCDKTLGSTYIAIKKIDVNTILDQNTENNSKPFTDQINYPIDQPATIMFTSGSQSKPKAVQHSFANHYYSAKGSNENIPVSLNDRWLLSLPLYHVSGLSILFRCLVGAGTIVLNDANNSIKKMIDQFQVTHVSFVSTQLYQCLSDQNTLDTLTKLKYILLGGSAISPSLLDQALHSNLPIYVSYGLTEMSSQVATTKKLKINDTHSHPIKMEILQYRKACIADDNEILVSGETLFQGYIADGCLNTGVNQDGWFHTKDIGRLDENNLLTITGRKDLMFISGGENIFPEEIEQCLKQIRSIEDAVIVPISNDQFGFRPVAFIKITENTEINRSILFQHLNSLLPKFKIPDEFYVWPDEITSDGIKIKRQDFVSLVQKDTDSLCKINN